MALKALMLRKRIDMLKAEHDALLETGTKLEAREAELTQAIEEVEHEEEQAAVEEAITSYEAEKAGYEEQKAALEDQIRELEAELGELEAEQESPAPAEPETRSENKITTRSEVHTMNRFGLTEEIVKREDVQAFLAETRTAMKEKRALTNVGLTIPQVLLGLLKQNVAEYSKLYKHVAVRAISGEGRLVIMDTIPEAVWTDCCANLNEATLTFYGWDFGCWKVGSYYAVCNAALEDSDIDLASEILQALGQGIGLALDKAILYGTGTRMPLGIVTRLAQTAAPATYPATARTWVDLHTSNIKALTANLTGAGLFKAISDAVSNAKGNYSRGELVFVCNEKTYSAIVGNSILATDDGRFVSAVSGAMPVVGGVIEVLNFIPDNVIIGGYFDLYTLVERAGSRFATSEHVRFLQDQTVFKGTARYDGAPAIAEGFVAIGLEGTTPNATMTFAADTANQGA